MHPPLVIRTPDPTNTTVLNPEVLDGAGVVLVPPGVERIAFHSIPDRPDQCGRTFIHPAHDTTEGRCAGLDGTEADGSADYASGPETPPPGLEDTDPDAIEHLLNAAARWGQAGVLRVARNLYHPDAWDAVNLQTPEDPAPESPDPDPWAIPVPYDVLEAGLRVLEDSAGGTCERTVDGALGVCFDNGHTADAPYGADRACVPCIAHRVLEGKPLPASPLVETHRAVIEDPIAGRLEVIATGDEHTCRSALSEHLTADPIADYHRGLIVEVLDA